MCRNVLLYSHWTVSSGGLWGGCHLNSEMQIIFNISTSMCKNRNILFFLNYDECVETLGSHSAYPGSEWWFHWRRLLRRWTATWPQPAGEWTTKVVTGRLREVKHFDNPTQHAVYSLTDVTLDVEFNSYLRTSPWKSLNLVLIVGDTNWQKPQKHIDGLEGELTCTIMAYMVISVYVLGLGIK